ncbi:MAG: hypothetical protein JSR45_01215 [Proteobacteria bacterium]|nr:hypothetical protein [Pseudomonadota bacterium]
MRKFWFALATSGLLVAGCTAAEPPQAGTPRADALTVAMAGPAHSSRDREANRRQYYDARTGRYYYYDPGTGYYFWENGARRP